eukprot:366000-Chlamydomonas_euryale.AAC.13
MQMRMLIHAPPNSVLKFLSMMQKPVPPVGPPPGPPLPGLQAIAPTLLGGAWLDLVGSLTSSSMVGLQGEGAPANGAAEDAPQSDGSETETLEPSSEHNGSEHQQIMGMLIIMEKKCSS